MIFLQCAPYSIFTIILLFVISISITSTISSNNNDNDNIQTNLNKLIDSNYNQIGWSPYEYYDIKGDNLFKDNCGNLMVEYIKGANMTNIIMLAKKIRIVKAASYDRSDWNFTQSTKNKEKFQQAFKLILSTKYKDLIKKYINNTLDIYLDPAIVDIKLHSDYGIDQDNIINDFLDYYFTVPNDNKLQSAFTKYDAILDGKFDYSRFARNTIIMNRLSKALIKMANKYNNKIAFQSVLNMGKFYKRDYDIRDELDINNEEFVSMILKFYKHNEIVNLKLKYFLKDKGYKFV